MSDQPGPYTGHVSAGYAPVQAGPPKTMSLVSMILSLSSVLGLLFAFLGLPLAIAGLVTGILARRREPHARAFWLTGIIVGAVITGLMLVYVAALVSFFVVAATTSS